MLLTGGINLLQGAPHPNAARLLMNYLLTKPAQQIQADDPGGPFIRKDVKPSIPELAHFTTAKPFPNNPDSYEFGSKLFFEWSAHVEPHLKAGLDAVKERDGISLNFQVSKATERWLEERGVLQGTKQASRGTKAKPKRMRA